MRNSRHARHPRPGHRSALQRWCAIFFLFLWMLSGGAHWSALQVFAWAGMLSDNLRTMPLDAALEETFDPGARCTVCTSIEEGRAHEDESMPSPRRADGDLLLLIPSPGHTLSVARPGIVLVPNYVMAHPLRGDSPPEPPPRTAAIG